MNKDFMILYEKEDLVFFKEDIFKKQKSIFIQGTGRYSSRPNHSRCTR